MRYNHLKLVAYSSGTSVVVNSELAKAGSIRFTTQYPAGLYGALQAWVPRKPEVPWAVKPPYRLVAYNRLTPVWEGRVTSPSIEDQAAARGQYLTALGYWGDVMMARYWRKWWADTRVSDDVWIRQEATGSTEEEFEIDQNYGYVHIMPKETTFADGDFVALRYTSPTGQTIKRITYDYDFSEDVQSWEMVLYDVTAAADIAASSITDDATPTGSHDITLATPRQAIELRVYSRANQVADLNKHVHAQWDALTVYSETGAINLTEIAKDVRAHVTELSASETLIASNTFSIVPFISEIDTLADILINAAGYGDPSFNPWAVGIRGSWLGQDNKPLLFAEQQPALTDYDYIIRQDATNLGAPFRASQDHSAIRNYIIVGYNTESGRTVYTTPDDDANLKDTTSIASYGERHEILSIDTTDSTKAVNWGRRFLAARKDPQWRVSGGIRIAGYVLGKFGGRVPSSEIQAGKRIKIANYLNDLSGNGLTFLITGTDYDDESEVNTLTVGQPDMLAPYLARQGR